VQDLELPQDLLLDRALDLQMDHLHPDTGHIIGR